MKRNIIAVILVFSLLMSFAACRKLEDSDAFVVESKVYVVDENGNEQNVQAEVNAEGETEYYYIAPDTGNKVTVNHKDVIVKTTKVPRTTATTNPILADLTPEEESFLNQFNDPEASDELIDSSVVTPEMDIAEGLLPEDAFDEIEVEVDSDGKPVHDDIKQTYEEIIKDNKFSMEITLKNVQDGKEVVVPLKAARDGDKVFFETAMPVDGQEGSMRFNVVVSDQKCYFIIPAMRAYMQVPAETMEEFVPGDIITEDVNSNLEYVSSGEVQYEGKTYICDVYNGEGFTVKYYYKDGELKRIENIVDENNMTIMEIQEVSKRVDNSKFKVPNNYMDMTKLLGENTDFSNLGR